MPGATLLQHGSGTYLPTVSKLYLPQDQKTYLKISSSQSLLRNHQIGHVSIISSMVPTSVLETNTKERVTILSHYKDNQKQHLHLDTEKHLHLDDQVEHLHLDDQEDHLQLDDQEEHLQLDDQEEHLNLDDQEEHLNRDDQKEHLVQSHDAPVTETADSMDAPTLIRALKQKIRLSRGISDLVLHTAINVRGIKNLNHLTHWAEGWKKKELIQQPFEKQLLHVGFPQHEIRIAIFVRKNENSHRNMQMWREAHRNDGLDSLIKCIGAYRTGKARGSDVTPHSVLQAMGVRLQLIDYAMKMKRYKVLQKLKITASPKTLAMSLGQLQVGQIIEGVVQGTWIKHYKGWSKAHNPTTKKVFLREVQSVATIDSLLQTSINVARNFSEKDYKRLLQQSQKAGTHKTGFLARREQEFYQAENQKRLEEKNLEEKSRRFQNTADIKTRRANERQQADEENTRKVAAFKEKERARKQEAKRKREADKLWEQEQRRRNEEEKRRNKEQAEKENERAKKEQERAKKEKEMAIRQNERPLPSGWNKVKDPNSGKFYYQNSITHQTQWGDPRIQEQAEQERRRREEIERRKKEAEVRLQQQAAASAAAQMTARQRRYGLPQTYDVRFQNGKPYFINHLTQQTQWNDPRPLPRGWKQMKDPNTGKFFYQNGITQTTQWQDPRTPIVP